MPAFVAFSYSSALVSARSDWEWKVPEAPVARFLAVGSDLPTAEKTAKKPTVAKAPAKKAAAKKTLGRKPRSA